MGRHQRAAYAAEFYIAVIRILSRRMTLAQGRD
jgi:hypothetical protein